MSTIDLHKTFNFRNWTSIHHTYNQTQETFCAAFQENGCVQDGASEQVFCSTEFTNNVILVNTLIGFVAIMVVILLFNEGYKSYRVNIKIF